MQAPSLQKYSFRIRTRSGMVVDKLNIHARDADEAERKLRQIYRDCTILDRGATNPVAAQASSMSFDDVARLIACQTTP